MKTGFITHLKGLQCAARFGKISNLCCFFNV